MYCVYYIAPEEGGRGGGRGEGILQAVMQTRQEGGNLTPHPL